MSRNDNIMHKSETYVKTGRQGRTACFWRCVPVVLLLCVVGLTVAFQWVGAATNISAAATVSAEQPSKAKISLTPETEVLAYIGGKDSWKPKLLKSLEKGQEFQFDTHLCYVDQNGLIRMNPGVDVALLQKSDRPYDKSNSRFPNPEDVVRFIGKNNKHIRHDRMGTLQVNDRFFFQGSLYEAVEDKGSPTGLSLRKTNIVLNRVTDTLKRQANTLVNLTITDESGKDRVISGTPEHPFFVPKVGDYVAMNQLKNGTILQTGDGSLATVKNIESQKGNFTVYNFEVEGTHNYYVASANGGPMVNVHNQCIRNSHLAGKTHPKTNIPFDKDGFPDFSSVSKKDVKIEFSGSRAQDVRAANEAAGYTDTPIDHVWHHHQDGTTMQLVPKTIHEQTGHTGGFSH